jgi:hypothetical protein
MNMKITKLSIRPRHDFSRLATVVHITRVHLENAKFSTRPRPTYGPGSATEATTMYLTAQTGYKTISETGASYLTDGDALDKK